MKDIEEKIRVLFVDDELNVLQAIRRTVHNMRDEWHTDFVSGGAAALELLAKSPADVIVSDMRMPGMDGWQLLAEVKALYPQTVRLLLSGHTETSSIMRAVGTAHQYLAKPCDSETLKAAIAQTQVLRRLLSNDRLARLVGDVGTLPSAPIAFQELLTCLQQPTASVADAARIIGRDVAMTANIMKLVNSAFFRVRQPISSAERAVAYLGLDTIGALVLGHSAFQSGAASSIPGFSLECCWQHSLRTGCAARAIALHENQPRARAEEAFLAGVLHDVGKVVYATRPIVAIDPAGSGNDTLSQMEAHHPEVGAYLLGLWGFPNSIVEAVAFHHAPSLGSGEGLTLPGLIHIADRLVHQRDDEASGSSNPGPEPEYLQKLGLADHVPQWSAALAP